MINFERDSKRADMVLFSFSISNFHDLGIFCFHNCTALSCIMNLSNDVTRCLKFIQMQFMHVNNSCFFIKVNIHNVKNQYRLQQKKNKFK